MGEERKKGRKRERKRKKEIEVKFKELVSMIVASLKFMGQASRLEIQGGTSVIVLMHSYFFVELVFAL